MNKYVVYFWNNRRWEKQTITNDMVPNFDSYVSKGLAFIFDTQSEADDKYNEIMNNLEIIAKADKGQLIDDISIWHTVFSETLIKILIFKYSTEVGKRVRVKVISDMIAKYNLDLVIKDFKPDYVIPENDKLKLIDGLKEVEAYNDGIYNRLAQAVGLEYGALHNEVVDAYERVIKTIHPTITPQIDGNTLAGELANAGGKP